ncbi:hypothetical protein SELMODRAFT_415943 [Selaginella moellendorffii]|uniref:Cysteine-rich transmembrane domain-containing protein n=1 Tax=Selaginella moellendorffii TaxID=88036 RepID=D8RXL4_SELML|nr:hypothetical protein SELMODRAFT_415943 [Selaginella moellendorffii]
MHHYGEHKTPPILPPPYQGYPPPGYPPPLSPHSHPHFHPPPGFPTQQQGSLIVASYGGGASSYYPPHQPQMYHQYQPYGQSPQNQSNVGCLEGCLAAMCCCCLLDACF